MATVELIVPARHDYLALVRLAVTAAVALDPALSDARLDDLRVAVSEACTNAVDAQDRPSSRVVIRCELAADEITVTVEDEAGGFDPDTLEALPAASDPGRLQHERGLGVPLMRTLADDVTFERRPDGTVVRLRMERGSRAS